MGVGRISQFVVLMLLPTLLFAGALGLPRAIRRVRRLLDRPNRHQDPRPTHPPIEQIAAELRRLLKAHEELSQSTDVPWRARRLSALEAAITDWAVKAAGALEVPCPASPVHGGFTTPDLRRLLHALTAAGLALPPSTRLLASGGPS